MNWDTSDKSVPWDVINRVVEDNALALAAAVVGDNNKISVEES
jgi:hypothetical protein